MIIACKTVKNTCEILFFFFFLVGFYIDTLKKADYMDLTSVRCFDT